MGASETATMQQWVNLRAESQKVALNKQPILQNSQSHHQADI